MLCARQTRTLVAKISSETRGRRVPVLIIIFNNTFTVCSTLGLARSSC